MNRHSDWSINPSPSWTIYPRTSDCIDSMRIFVCTCETGSLRISFTEGDQTGLAEVSHSGWSETNLDKVGGVPQGAHDILHQTIPFIWLQDVLPKQSRLTEVVFVCRVISARKLEFQKQYRNTLLQTKCSETLQQSAPTPSSWLKQLSLGLLREKFLKTWQPPMLWSIVIFNQ
jgi:hypothetical protein